MEGRRQATRVGFYFSLCLSVQCTVFFLCCLLELRRRRRKKERNKACAFIWQEQTSIAMAEYFPCPRWKGLAICQAHELDGQHSPHRLHIWRFSLTIPLIWQGSSWFALVRAFDIEAPSLTCVMIDAFNSWLRLFVCCFTSASPDKWKHNVQRNRLGCFRVLFYPPLRLLRPGVAETSMHSLETPCHRRHHQQSILTIPAILDCLFSEVINKSWLFQCLTCNYHESLGLSITLFVCLLFVCLFVVHASLLALRWKRSIMCRLTNVGGSMDQSSNKILDWGVFWVRCCCCVVLVVVVDHPLCFSCRHDGSVGILASPGVAPAFLSQ